MIIAPFLAIASGITLIWSAFLYQTVYYSLIESFPLEFQNSLTSRYAFPEIALSPSTPLALQANYIRSLIGFCVAALGFTLFSIFFFEQSVPRLLTLMIFFGIAFSTFKSWKAYKANCNRKLTHDDNQKS